MTDRIKKLLGNLRGYPLIVIGLAAGILLIFIGNRSNSIDSSSTSTNNNAGTAETSQYASQSADAWAVALEERIKVLLSAIPSVQNPEVMVIPFTGSEYYYAQNGSTSENSKTKEYVIINNGVEVPVLIHEIYPELRGIAVVAPGVSEETAYQIINLLSTLFDLPSNHIYVTG